jgi:hypothetical protein
MCNNTNNEGSQCIAEILQVICVLQKNAETCGDTCLETCDRGFLGCGNTTLGCNTRPVMLYTCCGNGTPWSMPTTRENVDCNSDNTTCSSVFRVEKINGNCCTFRVLANNDDTTTSSTIPYVATNSFFTMNLNCCCCMRCLPDTYVECI